MEFHEIYHPSGGKARHNAKVRDPSQATDNRTATGYKAAIVGLDKAMATVAQYAQRGHQELADAPYVT